MKANELSKELRIGNLVYVSWNEGKKIETNYGVFDLPEGGMSGWDNSTGMRIATTPKGYCVHMKIVSPIPLIGKWLKKFGHRHINGNWIIDAGKTYQGKRELYVYKIKGEWCCSLGGGITLCKFKYVHTYQNIYFALTNTELKIK